MKSSSSKKALINYAKRKAFYLKDKSFKKNELKSGKDFLCANIIRQNISEKDILSILMSFGLTLFAARMLFVSLLDPEPSTKIVTTIFGSALLMTAFLSAMRTFNQEWEVEVKKDGFIVRPV